MKKFTYCFDSLKGVTEEQIRARFCGYEYIVEHGGVMMDGYYTADSGTIEAANELAACEKLFFFYNFHRPAGYTGPSMSVSDIVRLWDNDTEPATKTTWYCDNVGFVQIDDDGKAIAE